MLIVSRGKSKGSEPCGGKRTGILCAIFLHIFHAKQDRADKNQVDIRGELVQSGQFVGFWEVREVCGGRIFDQLVKAKRAIKECPLLG